MEVKQYSSEQPPIKEDAKVEIKVFLETYKNISITYQNFWDETKAAFKGKFIIINTYIKKQGKISNK